jgi:ankyrin repeat protein
MPDPGSAILMALYQRKRDEADRLAAAAPQLTVWEASALGADDRLAALLDADPSLVNAWAPDGHTPLGLASFLAPVSTARLLIERDADVHAVARNDMKVQPLHAAVAARNVQTTALLLERGADPNARQHVGYTPLMGAAGSGLDDLVNLLLARGADPAAVSDDGKTASAMAREHGHQALAARLAPETT